MQAGISGKNNIDTTEAQWAALAGHKKGFPQKIMCKRNLDSYFSLFLLSFVGL